MRNLGYAKNSYPLFLIGFTIRARQKKVILCFWLVLRFGLVKPILWSTESGVRGAILGWIHYEEPIQASCLGKSYHLFLIGFTIRARQQKVILCFWLVLRFGLVKPILWSTDSGVGSPILGWRSYEEPGLCKKQLSFVSDWFYDSG